ncbi:nucleotide disphospho-sugar-binding domain-containing protein [Agrococcus sediminis]|uniref:nucleotide disphospho-sugar-binding domain-containing protein n=1 Tax=Agrococcus sediminis TaxID=2599924 RepID=UPI00382BEC8C
MAGSDDPQAPRSYLLGLTDAGGTVPPELGVARRLATRGHRVAVIGDRSMADATARAGAAFTAWSRPAVEVRDWAARSPGRLVRELAETMIIGPAPSQADDLAAAIAAEPPDVVLTSSFAVGAMIAAEAAGVPYGVLIPNIYPLGAEGIPPFGAGLRPARGRAGRIRDRSLTAASRRMFDRRALGGLNRVRSAHGLDPVATFWQQLLRAERLLILTSAAFDLPGALPAHARYVGPVLDDPAWAGAAAWLPPAGDEPLVLVAMSSTFQDHAECLQRVIDALATLPVRAVVTTGPAIDPASLRGASRVSVVRAAPHADAMRDASLVVTHGGHGTVVKALAAGCPLLLLPHGRDQADNAVRVVLRGAGRTISRRASSRRIAAAAAALLQDAGAAAAARRLGTAIVRDASGPALVDELESM